jgi:hypothetical protein
MLGQLPSAVALLIWLAALGGLGAFIWRRVRGIPIRGQRKATTTDPYAGQASAASMPPVPPGAAFPPAPTYPPAGGIPPGAGPAEPVDPYSSSSPSTLPTTPGPAPGAEVRGGFFARTQGDEPAVGPGARSRPTVSEAVQGIVMPCGLAPVIDGSQSIPNPFRVAFVTTEADAPTVGAGLADELERLGFSLATVTPTELLARRDDAELRVVLYVNPATAKRGLDLVFPAVAANAVGVELIT